MPRSLTAADRSALIKLASSMPAGSPERKAILAGLKTSASDPQLDFPSVLDPDRKAATESLYKKMQGFERKHGKSKEVSKVLDLLVSLNAALHRAEESLYTSKKSAATRYEHDGQLMTLAELAREAIGKDVFVDSRGRFQYNIVMDKSGDSSSVYKVTPSQWKKLRLPDLTPPRTREKVLDARLSQLRKGLSMSDVVDFNSWAKDTNASKEEMIAWLERRV